MKYFFYLKKVVVTANMHETSREWDNSSESDPGTPFEKTISRIANYLNYSRYMQCVLWKQFWGVNVDVLPC